MSENLYNPEALGEDLNDLEGIVSRARDRAAKKGPIDLVYVGLRVCIKEDTTYAQARILLADVMPFPHHTAADHALFNATPFIESREGALEAHVDAENPNITALSITRKFGKYLESERAKGVLIQACWSECFRRAGGELYPAYDMRTPVQSAMQAAWHRGAALVQVMQAKPDRPSGLIL